MTLDTICWCDYGDLVDRQDRASPVEGTAVYMLAVYLCILGFGLPVCIAARRWPVAHRLGLGQKFSCQAQKARFSKLARSAGGDRGRRLCLVRSS